MYVYFSEVHLCICISVECYLTKKACEVCEVCARLKHNRGQWNRHYKTVHLNIRNYTCHLCEKRFGRKSNLKKHLTSCKALPYDPPEIIFNGRKPSN